MLCMQMAPDVILRVVGLGKFLQRQALQSKQWTTRELEEETFFGDSRGGNLGRAA